MILIKSARDEVHSIALVYQQFRGICISYATVLAQQEIQADHIHHYVRVAQSLLSDGCVTVAVTIPRQRTGPPAFARRIAAIRVHQCNFQGTCSLLEAAA